MCDAVCFVRRMRALLHRVRQRSRSAVDPGRGRARRCVDARRPTIWRAISPASRSTTAAWRGASRQAPRSPSNRWPAMRVQFSTPPGCPKRMSSVTRWAGSSPCSWRSSSPTRVRSLALLCTFSGGKTAAPPTARMLWLGARTRIGTRQMRRRSFLRLVMPPGPIAEPDQMAERIAALFGHDLADQPSIVSEQLRALRTSDTSARLHELSRLPVLVMTGRHDPIGPPSAGRALADAIPGARYVEVADASHGLPISHAALTNATLRGHLGSA